MAKEIPPHPHAIMGEAARQWAQIIRPLLIQGYVQASIGAIGDLCFRYSSVLASIRDDPRAFGAYKMAMTYLQGFLEHCRTVQGRTLELFIDLTDRQFNELGFLLVNDLHFQRERKIRDDPRRY